MDNRDARLEKSVEMFLALFAVAFAGAILWVGSRIKVDYSDSYHIFLNARAILGEPATYSFYRGIIAGLWQAPWFWLADKLNLDGFLVSKLVSSLLFLAIGGAAYPLYRKVADRFTAGLATFFLMTVPIFIHYAPSAKEDLPATFFTLLGFSFYLKSQKRPFWNLTLAGLFFSLAMGCRYNLIPLFGLCLLLHRLWGPSAQVLRWDQRTKDLVFSLIFLPLILVILYPMLIFPSARGISFFAAPYQFIAELFVQFESNKAGYKPASAVYLFLLHAWQGTGALLALLGILEVIRRRNNLSRFFLIWFLVFLFAQAHLVSGKEVRYLFPLFPAVAFFVGLGATILIRTSRKPALRWIFAWLLVLWGGQRAVSEFNRFRDPFYREDFPRMLAKAAENTAQGGPLVWLGTYFEQHPRESVFHPLDDYAYVYHLYAHVIEFYLHRPVTALRGGHLQVTETGVFPQHIERILKGGETLIINPDPEDRVTRNLPETPESLWIEKLTLKGSQAHYDPILRLSRSEK